MVTAVNLAIQRVFWSTISKMVKQCRTWKNLYRAGRGSSKEQMVVDGKQSERLFDTGAECCHKNISENQGTGIRRSLVQQAN